MKFVYTCTQSESKSTGRKPYYFSTFEINSQNQPWVFYIFQLCHILSSCCWLLPFIPSTLSFVGVEIQIIALVKSFILQVSQGCSLKWLEKSNIYTLK